MHKRVIGLTFISTLLAFALPAAAQGNKLSESSLKIAEINRTIDEQRTKLKALTAQAEKTLRDSAAAAAKADKRIDSLNRVIQDLHSQAEREKKSLAELNEDRSGIDSAKARRDADRSTAAKESRSAITMFDALISSAKDSLAAAKSGLELARNDSIDLVKRIAKDAARQNDSLAAMEKSTALLRKKADRLSEAAKKLVADSASGRKAADDSLAAAQKRIQDLRRFIAGRDSAVKAATEEMNSSKKDSIAAQLENQKDSRKREKDIASIDSLLSASQARKTMLLRMREKFQLDSSVAVLSEKLRDFLNKPSELRAAATGPEAEQAQLLEVYKGKLDNIMRDEEFSAAVARAPGATWKEQNNWASGQLAALQPVMDSASAAREKITRDGILAGKEFAQIVKNFAAQNKTLNDGIARAWKELINAKPRLSKLEQDSASAVKYCETTSQTFSAKHAALSDQSSAAGAAADSIARQRAGLAALIAGKEPGRQKQVAAAAEAILQAAQAVRRCETALDNVTARQQKVRDDSARVDREKSVFVSQAQQVMEAKNEEIKLKNNAIDAIASKMTKARSDSAAAESDKQEQMNVFGKLLAEQHGLIKRGEKAVADLEAERAIAAAPPPAPPPAPVAAPQEPKPSAAQESAERQLTLLYELIDQGKTETAVRIFNANRKLLEKNLFPDAFEAIKTTIESLPPPLPSAPVAAKPAEPAVPVPQPASPAPVVPAPPPPAEPDVERKPATVFISSVPPVASVYMDGQLVGKTNVGYVKVTSGKHTMQFIKGDKTCTQEMTFEEGQNPAAVVKLPCGQ
ncbi:MAG TPA: PEGA domain-containing protein [Chitinivibrionales bacterium]|nr:PEGA domain-containing protein [Chitinivibrionales bacterium]